MKRTFSYTLLCVLRCADDSANESLLKMEQTNFSKRTKARKRKVSHFYRSTLCNSIIFIRSNNVHLLLSHSYLHPRWNTLCVHSKFGYFWINIHLQFHSQQMDMDIAILACYMVMNMSALQRKTIANSPNCAFISLEINHAVLLLILNPFDEIARNEHNFWITL